MAMVLIDTALAGCFIGPLPYETARDGDLRKYILDIGTMLR
jgi:hypothetical protein